MRKIKSSNEDEEEFLEEVAGSLGDTDDMHHAGAVLEEFEQIDDDQVGEGTDKVTSESDGNALPATRGLTEDQEGEVREKR